VTAVLAVLFLLCVVLLIAYVAQWVSEWVES
jgi:hypothetical protein